MLEPAEELERLGREQWEKRQKENEVPLPAALNEWDAGDDIDPPSPREWLLGTAFCRCFLSSLLGDGGVGKSAMRVAQAMALASGRPLTGEFVHKRTKVLIVSLEDDAAELRRRVLAARIHHGVSPAELKDWLYLAAPSRGVGKLMMLNPKGHVVEGALGKTLEDVIVRREIGLIVLDPLVKTHSVPENLNNEMDSVAQLLSDLAAKHNVAVDFPHHVSKGTADPGNANRGRGATATVNAGRLVYTLSTMIPEEAKLLNVPEDQRRQYVRLDRAKINIAPAAGTATWFRLVGVRIGNPTPDYPNGDEVQTVEPWQPSKGDTLDGPTIRKILDALGRGLDDGQNHYTDQPNTKGREAWKVVNRYAKDKSELACKGFIKTWVREGALVSFPYKNPLTHKNVKGLKVDPIMAAEIIATAGPGDATETSTGDDADDISIL